MGRLGWLVARDLYRYTGWVTVETSRCKTWSAPYGRLYGVTGSQAWGGTRGHLVGRNRVRGLGSQVARGRPKRIR